jgi:DNA-binding MarR family transcriptional regulator
MVDRLEADGLARRESSGRDRRVVLLDLSAAGEALVETVAAQHFDEIRRQEPSLRKWLGRLAQIAPSASPAPRNAAKPPFPA